MRWLIGVLATILTDGVLVFVVAFGHCAPTVLMIVVLIFAATTLLGVVAVDTYR